MSASKQKPKVIIKLCSSFILAKKKKEGHTHKIKFHIFELFILKESLNESQKTAKKKKWKKKGLLASANFSQIQEKVEKSRQFSPHRPTNKRMEPKNSYLILK